MLDPGGGAHGDHHRHPDGLPHLDLPMHVVDVTTITASPTGSYRIQKRQRLSEAADSDPGIGRYAASGCSRKIVDPTVFKDERGVQRFGCAQVSDETCSRLRKARLFLVSPRPVRADTMSRLGAAGGVVVVNPLFQGLLSELQTLERLSVAEEVSTHCDGNTQFARRRSPPSPLDTAAQPRSTPSVRESQRPTEATGNHRPKPKRQASPEVIHAYGAA